MNIAWQKTWASIKTSFPIVIGILLLISLLNPFFQKYYPQIFTGNYLVDPLIGTIVGSISFGIPIASYVAGGELLAKGVSLLAVTAFIYSWTTVGVAMLPLEATHLGKRFAMLRNTVNFLVSIIIAILTIVTLKIIS